MISVLCCLMCLGFLLHLHLYLKMFVFSSPSSRFFFQLFSLLITKFVCFSFFFCVTLLFWVVFLCFVFSFLCVFIYFGCRSIVSFSFVTWLYWALVPVFFSSFLFSLCAVFENQKFQISSSTRVTIT